MKIQLIEGEFSANEALELVGQLMVIKIKYHENKITRSSSEEDIKYRESKIKGLQKELYEFRKNTEQGPPMVKLEASIHIK